MVNLKISVMGIGVAFMMPFVALAQTVPPAPQKADSTAAENPSDFSRSVLHYEDAGKRDPFDSLAPRTEEEEKKIRGLFNYERASLKGIVTAENDSYALVIDENGMGYVLRKGYRVFGGYVTDITADSVFLHIVVYGRSMEIVMRLESSRTTTIIERQEGESSVQRPGISIDYYKQNTTVEVPTIGIEEVIIPDGDIRTVEEDWFGSEMTETTASTGEMQEENVPDVVSTVETVDPPDGAWISMPYVFDWTVYESVDVKYTLIIDDDPDCMSPLFVKERLATSSFVVDDRTQLPALKILYWAVSVKSDAGQEILRTTGNAAFRIRK